MKATVSAVVVTHRSGPELAQCLDALGAAAAVREVVVVDNASDDDSVRIAEAHPAVTHVVPLDCNAGFGAACNLGVFFATGEQLLFVNPDAVVAAGTVAALVEHLIAHPTAAAVGPRLRDGAGRVQRLQAFPGLRQVVARHWAPFAKHLGWRDRSPRVPRGGGPVDWISGACMLVDRQAWQVVGSFDPGFFLYYEETDWCRRAWDAGWEVHHLPRVEATHLGGRSASRSGRALHRRQVRAVFRRSRCRYFRKHFGLLAACAVELVLAARLAYDGLRSRTQS